MAVPAAGAAPCSGPVPLAGALGASLPNEDQTRLLRAALWPLPRARPELLAWQAEQDRPTAAIARPIGGGRLLAPLIARTLMPDPAGVDGRLLTYLRTAVVREELRTAEYRRIATTVLAALAHAEVPFLALKGAALGETVYPDPHLRHSRDIDVLVRRRDFERAARAVATAGFAPDGTGGPPNGLLGHQVHETGLPLVLHTGLFFFPRWNVPLDDVWARSEERALLGVPARVLGPSDQLLHVCAHAMTGVHRNGLLWACDAWLVAARRRDLDWDALLERGERMRAGLALHVTLEWLARALEAPVPSPVLERLAALARAEDRFGRELLLWGAWAGPDLRLSRFLTRATGWRERAFLLRWRFLPSPQVLVSMRRIRRPAAAPLYYLARPFRMVARKLRGNPPPATPARTGLLAPDASELPVAADA